MNREREQLIDFVLGELPEGEAPAVAARIARDPGTAAEREELLAAAGLVRAAAATGWPAPAEAPSRPRLRLLRPALAAAAVLLIALAALLVNGSPPRAIYEPDVAYGYLLPEETDARGHVPEPSVAREITLRAGKGCFSALGAEREDDLRVGDVVPYDSDVKTPADTGARIDLPGGGILFVGPLSTVRVRRHDDGGPAVRVLMGVACTVAGGRPLHLAVHETDLLVHQESGAILLRQSPAEVITLRGQSDLLLSGGKRFRIPPGERLPAACAREPYTATATADELDLDWYLTLNYGGGIVQDVTWSEPGHSAPLEAPPGTMLFLRLLPAERGSCTLSFGGDERRYPLHAGVPLRLRLALEELGPGPRLVVSPAEAIKAARLFRPAPE